MIIFVEVEKHEKPQSESQIKTTFDCAFLFGKFLCTATGIKESAFLQLQLKLETMCHFFGFINIKIDNPFKD